MYMIRIDTKSISLSFHLEWTPKKTQNRSKKQQQFKWVLCSLHFKDIVIIVLKDLNSTQMMLQYEEISAKQVQKRYFKYSATRPNRQREEDQNGTLELQKD